MGLNQSKSLELTPKANQSTVNTSTDSSINPIQNNILVSNFQEEVNKVELLSEEIIGSKSITEKRSSLAVHDEI